VLARANHSTTIQISNNDAIVAMVNPDVGTVSFFNTATKSKSGSASFGPNSQPEGVAILPDNTTAIVILRQAQQLAKVTGINTVTPMVDATRATVGSEPTGVALTPTGSVAVVANFAEGTLTFVNTGTMAVIGTAAVGGNPRALAISNDGDGDDMDEKVYVTQFFGEAVTEVSDQGRIGKVQVVDKRAAGWRSRWLLESAAAYERQRAAALRFVAQPCFGLRLGGGRCPLRLLAS
jgi:DNA-binding beta-propeller fold protein YncE